MWSTSNTFSSLCYCVFFYLCLLHFLHKGAFWNGIVCSNALIMSKGNSKHCCLREFSFYLHRKFIFHFPSARIEFFLWRTYHIFVAKLDKIIFLKYWAIFDSQLTKRLGVKSFDPPLVKKTNSCRFSRKRVKFELQLPHSLLFIFSKNHL